MEHFINIIYKQNADSHGIAECIASGSNILTESSIDFYTGELDTSEKIITMALPEAVKDIDNAAQDIAMRLFEFGLKEFDIEITEETSGTLRRGMRGEEVKKLQQQLGMPAAEQDGIFGPKTERAVRTFQQNAGIQVDGIVGRQTQSTLLKYRAPELGIKSVEPGGGYIDAPYPKTQPKAKPDGKTVAPKIKPKLRPKPKGDLAQLPKGIQGMDIDKDDPRDDSDSGFRKGQAPKSMFATDKPDHEDKGYAYVIPAPEGAGYSVILPGGQLWRELNNGMGRSSSEEKAQSAADRINKDQGLTVPKKGTTSSKLDQKGKTPVDPSRGSPTPDVDDSDIVQPVSDPDENEPDSARQSPKMPTPGQDSEVPRMIAPKLDTPGAEKSPKLPGVNDKTQRQDIDQKQWEKKYGSAPRDLSAGLPAEFTTQYLNPALDDLTSDAAGDLASEVKGAPPPVAILVMDRMRQMLGVENGDEILDMAREIEQEEPDQASALSTLAEIYKQLEDTAMPKDESVAPRPKGAFMFRERNEWNAQFRNTHNIDGTPKQLTESIEDYQVTYEDDDKFYEDYGVMWYNEDETIDEAEYQGRKVKLGKPMKGDVKKFKVYVKNPKGNVVKVNFGQKGVKIKKDNPARRRSFRARHNCANPGPRHKARYWSCRKW